MPGHSSLFMILGELPAMIPVRNRKCKFGIFVLLLSECRL